MNYKNSYNKMKNLKYTKIFTIVYIIFKKLCNYKKISGFLREN